MSIQESYREEMPYRRYFIGKGRLLKILFML
jgi:hypothetical protein